MLLEIACFNLESCRIAQAAGADRIELCGNYAEGGVTPGEELIVAARRTLNIPLHVIIRPRGGNFIYDEEEIGAMENSILYCKLQKVDGVVLGVLNADGTVNVGTCKKLVALARPLRVTFHRAIDDCRDIIQGIGQIEALGIERVLTGGGKPTALEGLPLLSDLCARFRNRIIIMPGGGIRSGNIEKLKNSGAHEFHSAAIVNETGLADTEEIRRLKQLIQS